MNKSIYIVIIKGVFMKAKHLVTLMVCFMIIAIQGSESPFKPSPEVPHEKAVRAQQYARNNQSKQKHGKRLGTGKQLLLRANNGQSKRVKQ
jgi:hypothetical protein